MLVLAQSKAQPLVQPLPEPTGDAEIKAPEGDESSEILPVHFPSFQQFVSQGLPELTGLSLDLISPADLSHMLSLQLEPEQHPLCPRAGTEQPHPQSSPGHSGDPGGHWKKGPHLALLEPKA